MDDVLKNARKEAGDGASDKDVAAYAFKTLAVAFGRKILDIVPGRVSTEVDARMSYDTQKTMDQAHDIIDQYDKAGISRDRVLIKIASTWEGIKAAEQLETRGDSLQPDAAVRHASGDCVRGGEGDADLAVRGTHSGLVQEGHGQGLPGRG